MPTDPPAEPPCWKMAVLTFVGLYPPLLLVLWALGPLLEPLPFALRTAVIAGLLVTAMVFAIMPALRRTFAGWLRR